MSTLTYYVALPFLLTEDGELVAGEAQDRQTAGAAIGAAEDMAQRFGGAIAFSRTGDPATGVFDDAVILRTFGEIPSKGMMLTEA